MSPPPWPLINSPSGALGVTLGNRGLAGQFLSGQSEEVLKEVLKEVSCSSWPLNVFRLRWWSRGPDQDWHGSFRLHKPSWASLLPAIQHVSSHLTYPLRVLISSRKNHQI